jgi:hypothetical protein
VPESFPDPRVARAYLKPAASYDPQPFDWQVPDAAGLRAFCSERLGWTNQQISATIDPVLQRYAQRSIQVRRCPVLHHIALTLAGCCLDTHRLPLPHLPQRHALRQNHQRPPPGGSGADHRQADQPVAQRHRRPAQGRKEDEVVYCNSAIMKMRLCTRLWFLIVSGRERGNPRPSVPFVRCCNSATADLPFAAPILTASCQVNAPTSQF